MFTVRIVRNTEKQNEDLLTVKLGGTYSYHWILKCLIRSFDTLASCIRASATLLLPTV
jgi:hypothetical protein